MIREEAVGAFKEVGINDLKAVISVIVIPGNVHSIPFVIIHEYIVPHMSCRGLFVPVAENADARDTDAVADELESFGIALTDNARLYESTDSR